MAGFCFPHVSKMLTINYNWENNFIIKNAIILNIIHVFNLRDTEVVVCMILVNLRYTEVVVCMILVNLRDTEVVVCMILVLLQRTDDLNHYLNIRQYTRPSLDIIGKQ